MPRSIAEHVAFVTSLVSPLPARSMPPETGLVLAVDAVARLAVPPFDNSAMDGFLAHRADLPGELRVVADVPAGGRPARLGPGEAARIMTGAPVGPDGDCVIPVEDTDHPAGPGPLPATVRVPAYSGRSHIRPRGDNSSPGDVVLAAGSPIDAGALAALISAGVTEVRAHPRPRVAVISSGDELVATGQPLAEGQIPDSNLPMLAALARANGAADVLQLHASDRDGDFRAVLDEAAAAADVVVTSGGVSTGAFDVVKAVTSGHDMWFGSVAMRPGSPQGAGLWNGQPLLCLPGNPVAAFVSFHLFVAPVLRRLAGDARPVSRVRLAGGVDTFPAAGGVTRIVPVRLTFDGEITAEPFHSRAASHLVASLAGTDGLAVITGGDTIDIILTRN